MTNEPKDEQQDEQRSREQKHHRFGWSGYFPFSGVLGFIVSVPCLLIIAMSVFILIYASLSVALNIEGDFEKHAIKDWGLIVVSISATLLLVPNKIRQSNPADSRKALIVVVGLVVACVLGLFARWY